MSLYQLPNEILLGILTSLRSTDNAALQLTCSVFNNPVLIDKVVRHVACKVYPVDLTAGYDCEETALLLKQPPSSPSRKQQQVHVNKTESHSSSHENHHPLLTYWTMRNMELLVVARVLSRPEPVRKEGSFYISKAWCRAALKWLESEQLKQNEATRRTNNNNPMIGKKKRKQKRQTNRRLSDAMPPWANMTGDLTCNHQNLAVAESQRKANATRRVMDRLAWKVLRALYPESKSLCIDDGECLHCRMQQESERRAIEIKKERDDFERKMPLSCPIVRAFYKRTKGVPEDDLVKNSSTSGCPLVPGHYHLIPRAWCNKWRRYIKSGGAPPSVPDAGNLLCDGHKLPLIPPHVEAFLYGEASQLFATYENVESINMMSDLDAQIAAQRHGGRLDNNIRQQQQLQVLNNHRLNEQLDKENNVVCEILSDREFSALEKWWPKVHVKFTLRFTVSTRRVIHEGYIDGYGYVEEEIEEVAILWGTEPCRECYSGNTCDIKIGNRNRHVVSKSPKFRKRR